MFFVHIEKSYLNHIIIRIHATSLSLKYALDLHSYIFLLQVERTVLKYRVVEEKVNTPYFSASSNRKRKLLVPTYRKLSTNILEIKSIFK